MVTTGGIINVKCSPRIVYHAPIGAGTYYTDFDGESVRIKRVKLYGSRVAGKYSMVWLSIPGEVVPINLAMIKSQDVAAAGTDGLGISDEYRGCLDVPKGTKLYWQVDTDLWFFLLEYDVIK